MQHARAANDKNDKDGHIGEWQEIGRADYLWDGDVILKESLSNDTGEIVRETAWHFEPDSFVPLAREEAGHLSYVVTDHLGTPRELISEAGELVWAAEYTTWGEVRRLWQAENDDDGPPGSGGFQGYDADGQPVYGTRPGSSPQGDPGGGGGLVSGNLALKASDDPDPYHCPIRFQGQWADAETGLYYNRFRYYDAGSSQYLSPDPIGLWGGIQIQGYVPGPSSWVDPLGLNCATWLQNIHKNTKNFHATMQKYDPILDAMGGHKSFRSGRLKYTKPGGHYEKLRNFQRGIIKDLVKFARHNCYKCASLNDMRKIAAGGRVVNKPVEVPPGISPIRLPTGQSL